MKYYICFTFITHVNLYMQRKRAKYIMALLKKIHGLLLNIRLHQIRIVYLSYMQVSNKGYIFTECSNAKNDSHVYKDVCIHVLSLCRSHCQDGTVVGWLVLWCLTPLPIIFQS